MLLIKVSQRRMTMLWIIKLKQIEVQRRVLPESIKFYRL